MSLAQERDGAAERPAPVVAKEELVALCDRYGDARGRRADALIEIFHDIQERHACVPEAALPILAEALNLSRAEVHGVLSFYHDFRRQPAGRRIVKLCRAEACQARGAEPLIEQICQRLGLALGETSADGAVTLEAAYCLGNCALGPAALVEEVHGRSVLHGRLDAGRLEALVAGRESAA